jgi:hypothetical protein
MRKAAIIGERFGKRSPVAGYYPAREGPGSSDGYLLAEHRANGELGTVDAPRNASARHAADARREERIVGQYVGDGYWIGVEIQ